MIFKQCKGSDWRSEITDTHLSEYFHMKRYSIIFNSIPFQSIPACSILFNSILFESPLVLLILFCFILTYSSLVESLSPQAFSPTYQMRAE